MKLWAIDPAGRSPVRSPIRWMPSDWLRETRFPATVFATEPEPTALRSIRIPSPALSRMKFAAVPSDWTTGGDVMGLDVGPVPPMRLAALQPIVLPERSALATVPLTVSGVLAAVAMIQTPGPPFGMGSLESLVPSETPPIMFPSTTLPDAESELFAPGFASFALGFALFERTAISTPAVP